ncbi:hypothetical protein DV735_g5700, partial [Chaetothyriales sp. CBS 134920]
MSQDGPEQARTLPVRAITALKQDAGITQEPLSFAMERSFSEDIQEGTQELKEAAEQTKNIILDLSLDGIVRWVSPSWADVVGTDLEQVKDQPISKFISDNPSVFEPAIQALKSNASKSQFVKFAVITGPLLDAEPNVEGSTAGKELMDHDREDRDKTKVDDGDGDETASAPDDKPALELEGQGIMVYDRATGSESHTMWMLQPATDSPPIEISLPQTLVDSLGVGAEILAKYLAELAESGGPDADDNPPPPPPILCRVCERSVVPWWFEKHSDLCVQEHKAEMDVQMVQESLAEHRHAIVKILDAFEARQGRQNTSKTTPGTQPEYKGQPIGPASTNSSSGQASTATSPYRSRSPSVAGLAAPIRPRSFIVRRPLVRIVELILDLCDTALEISTPTIKDGKSPSSESRISQILGWQQPSSLDNEPALMALALDTEKLARAKVEMVYRHRSILEYSERIRQECMAEVDACISEALLDAEHARGDEDLSCSGSEDEGEESTASQLREAISSAGFTSGCLSDEPTPMPLPQDAEPTSYIGIKSMAQALRNPNEMQVIKLPSQSRVLSRAVSTGSNSPAECPTPKSRRGTQLSQAQSFRRSVYGEDVNDSDGSLPSSSFASSHIPVESPASQSDLGLSRTRSSRERNRRSIHLHNLGSSSPQRQPSPGRCPPPPSSPLRLSKPRIPSTERSTSPIISPLLTAGEFMPQAAPVQHHRRQSSIHSSDLRAPISPHLNSITRPQERAMPPSIKDFEIIKPISRGAFGSVYLAKKKRTGEYFAIKVLRKSDMIAKNQVTNVKAERAIMMWQGESDFVAKLYYTFSTKDCLFLVMEYLNGGDCAALVKILGGLTEDWAKKYIAEVVLGVQHLHTRGIVHRDLKPDNLLIDSKGHLKLTDFGLSRMGLVGRQKRALKQPDDEVPDLLKNGPFPQSDSTPATRSASFDFQGQISSSPAHTPLMTPALGLEPPSYFSLTSERSLSRRLSRRPSGYRSDSGSVSSHDLHHAFKNFSLHDNESHHGSAQSRSGLIEEEGGSVGSESPDLLPLSQSMSNIMIPPAPASHEMLPPPTALFDPEESDKRFVGTPDYLAPETINGRGQDEMCDWWSVGCIMFEFLFGYPPFNAETPDQVFDNILNRRIAWPDPEEVEVSDEARDLINKLIQLEPNERLGANKDDKFENGGQEIQAHPWFADINWNTLLEDEAQFVPHPEHPEDTEYFDSRGATLSSFPEELEDQISPGLPNGDYGDRPHDALFRARLQGGNNKRGLVPLHIPPHVAGERSRRLSEPMIADDFGNFTYKNLPVLEKANKDIVEKMRKEAMQAQSRVYTSQAVSTSNTPAIGSPAPSLDGSPMVPMPVKRALSISSKGHRPQSPSGLGALNSSPSRPSQPSSPLLVQFSMSQHHERRKTSGGSSQSSSSLQPGGFFDIAADPKVSSAASSPIKQMRVPAVPATASPAKPTVPTRTSSVHGRTRSQTVGSQDSEYPALREPFIPSHHKRRSQLFARDQSPSSSDNESAQQKALLKVQRRRQSSRRLSQFNLLDGPSYRPLDVLIVEDHPVSKMVMEKLFEKLKCRTITASNGPEALRLAVSPIPFDIIFMEFKLPIINGIDIARMIRDTKSANSTTPIVCVTGYLKDLPETHHFDTLMQKPPTIPKLTEELCKFCQWKPPPRDFKPSVPLVIPTTAIRLDQMASQDSPSSVASSLAPTMPDFSWKSSSREDSVGSGGFFGELDSLKADDISLIISRATTDEWSNRGGLGISDETVMGQRAAGQSRPQLFPSATASGAVEASTTLSATDIRTPMRKRSSEAIQSKREQMAKRGIETTRPEEGDDEDEELGHAQIQQKSPVGKTARQTSKLGIEMMRTNSRGSVISLHDERTAEPESLRKSLELLEERMEGMKIMEEVDGTALAAAQPRKTDRTVSSHSHPDARSRPLSFGHITPPEMFPPKPGHLVADFVETETGPVLTKTSEGELEQAQKPQDASSGPNNV